MSISVTLPNQNTEKETIGRSKEVFLLVILATIQFTYLMDYVLIMPLGSILSKELELNPTQFGYLISSYTFAASIIGFIASFYIDRFDRKKALLFVLVGYSAGPFFASIADNFWLLLAARIVSGAFGGMLSSLIMTIIGDLVPVERLGRGTSFVVSANAFASILGVPAGIFLANRFGWHAPYEFVIIVTLILIAIIFFYLPSMTKHLNGGKRLKGKLVLSLLKNPDIKFPLLFMSVLTLAGSYTILPFLSTYLSQNMGFTNQQIVLVFFFGGIASFIATPTVGFLSDKFGKQNMFLLINFIAIITIIMVSVYPHESITMALICTSLFFMFSTGRLVSGMTLVNSRFQKENRGRLMSITSSITMFVGTIGTYLSGLILYTENGMMQNFDLIGTMAVSATIICIFTAFILDE